MRRYFYDDVAGDDSPTKMEITPTPIPVRIVSQDITMPAWQSAAIAISVFASLATLWNVLYGQRRSK